MMLTNLLIGIDVGGTFTDAVVLDGNNGHVLEAFKLPSTPYDPGAAVIFALERVAQSRDITGALVCHGTTVGTNTLIERKGAKTALLSTEGFTDVIEIGRQNRPNLYDLTVSISKPLVPASLRIGVAERMDASGNVVRKIENIDHVLSSIKNSGVDSVAISFLHAYANNEHESEICRAIKEAFPNIFVTASSDVCPEYREYERTSTTVVNAYVGPAINHYMKQLDERSRALGVDDLMIVKSNGGLTSPSNAASYPVHLIESGPAAGLVAAAAYAASTERRRVIAFDMGGTTAKAGVILDYQPKMTDEFLADQLVDGQNVGGYPIRSSVLDIVEIGAGGGSIAWIDEGGVLHVGPESAGADPGPACYSRGGQFPTVSDAHAVIGTLEPETFEGSGVTFSKELAVEKIREKIAEPMGWTVARAAHGIIDIAVANMAEMVRLVTVRRGLDPRDFTILAAGGAGPLHASSVGSEIQAKEIVIPPLPGMFSALGAILGEIRHDLSTTMLMPLADITVDKLNVGFASLKEKAVRLLMQEPGAKIPTDFVRLADLRFLGQLFELSVPLGAFDGDMPSVSDIDARFRALYYEEYGFDLENASVQLVNLRLVATRSFGGAPDQIFAGSQIDEIDVSPVRIGTFLDANEVSKALPIYKSNDSLGGRLQGPALIEHAGSTVWIREGQTAMVGADGSISISIDHQGIYGND